MSLMLKELQPFLLFLYWETVSKNRKRRDREQVCLSVHSLPRESTRALSHRGSTRAPRWLSEPRFSSGGDSTKPTSPSFSLPELLARPLAHTYCSAQGAPRLAPWLLVPPLRPPSPSHCSSLEATGPALPLQPGRRSAGGTWALRKGEG